MFSRFSPAPCSPPLGGSDADSAVRFTPAESRAGAKSGYSDAILVVFDALLARAHHKLERARGVIILLSHYLYSILYLAAPAIN